jgi:hypothetical protein
VQVVLADAVLELAAGAVQVEVIEVLDPLRITKVLKQACGSVTVDDDSIFKCLVQRAILAEVGIVLVAKHLAGGALFDRTGPVCTAELTVFAGLWAEPTAFVALAVVAAILAVAVRNTLTLPIEAAFPQRRAVCRAHRQVVSGAIVIALVDKVLVWSQPTDVFALRAPNGTALFLGTKGSVLACAAVPSAAIRAADSGVGAERFAAHAIITGQPIRARCVTRAVAVYLVTGLVPVGLVPVRLVPVGLVPVRLVPVGLVPVRLVSVGLDIQGRH